MTKAMLFPNYDWTECQISAHGYPTQASNVQRRRIHICSSRTHRVMPFEVLPACVLFADSVYVFNLLVFQEHFFPINLDVRFNVYLEDRQ